MKSQQENVLSVSFQNALCESRPVLSHWLLSPSLCLPLLQISADFQASKLLGCITKVKVNNPGLFSCLVWFGLVLFLLGHSCKSWVAKPVDMDMDVLSCIKTVILVKRESVSRPCLSIKNQCIVRLFYNYHNYNSQILSYIDQKFCQYLVILNNRTYIHYS